MTTAPREELERQLEMSNSQLRRYAADMKQVVEAERRRGRELAAANERLARLDRLKSDFLSFISHELRTPLNHMSAVDLFDPDASAEEQAETVGMIREGYERLNSLVRRGLDYFYWISREPGSVTGAAAWPLALCQAAERRNVAVEWTPHGGEKPVEADPEAVEAIFAELVHNARKHGPPGGTVTVASVVTASRTFVSVRDSGGFPPEMAEEIFRPFTIVETRSHADGSGLGLALARAMAIACGGSLRAESRGPGTGTEFILELKNVID